MDNKKNKGFTLLELLVVIAIIGIMSAIAMTAMSSARASGRDGRRITDIRQLQNALELYYSTFKAYPAILTSLVPTYIKTQPLDPKSGVAYFYLPLSIATTPCNGYHLGADLETNNKVLSTDSDVDSSSIGATLKCGSTSTGLVGGTGIYPASGSESSAGCSGASGVLCYDIKK